MADPDDLVDRRLGHRAGHRPTGASSSLTSYSFTKLVVDDLDAMERYYVDVYDFARLQRLTTELGGVAIDEIILGVGDAFSGLILWRWLGQAPPPTGEVILGFTTLDIHALTARAEAAGGTVRQHPNASAVAPGMIVGFVADPEGHLAEVVQRQP